MMSFKSKLALTALTASLAFALPAVAATVEVGGAPMRSSKSIPDNAAKARNLTTLVAAVKAAGLVQTLKGQGPFTVFAPTNDAFAKLPAGTVDTLLKPENKAELTKILTFHVVAGKLTTHDLVKLATEAGGNATLTTLEGGTIQVGNKGGKWAVWDGNGAVSFIETRDVMQKNGVVHVIDTVLMPASGEAAAPAETNVAPDASAPADAIAPAEEAPDATDVVPEPVSKPAPTGAPEPRG